MDAECDRRRGGRDSHISRKRRLNRSTSNKSSRAAGDSNTGRYQARRPVEQFYRVQQDCATELYESEKLLDYRAIIKKIAWTPDRNGNSDGNKVAKADVCIWRMKIQ